MTLIVYWLQSCIIDLQYALLENVYFRAMIYTLFTVFIGGFAFELVLSIALSIQVKKLILFNPLKIKEYKNNNFYNAVSPKNQSKLYRFFRIKRYNPYANKSFRALQYAKQYIPESVKQFRSLRFIRWYNNFAPLYLSASRYNHFRQFYSFSSRYSVNSFIPKQLKTFIYFNRIKFYRMMNSDSMKFLKSLSFQNAVRLQREHFVRETTTLLLKAKHYQNDFNTKSWLNSDFRRAKILARDNFVMLQNDSHYQNAIRLQREHFVRETTTLLLKAKHYQTDFNTKSWLNADYRSAKIQARDNFIKLQNDKNYQKYLADKRDLSMKQFYSKHPQYNKKK